MQLSTVPVARYTVLLHFMACVACCGQLKHTPRLFPNCVGA
jgi:hypothetical protein